MQFSEKMGREVIDGEICCKEGQVDRTMVPLALECCFSPMASAQSLPWASFEVLQATETNGPDHVVSQQSHRRMNRSMQS